jgi:hypothetical protein
MNPIRLSKEVFLRICAVAVPHDDWPIEFGDAERHLWCTPISLLGRFSRRGSLLNTWHYHSVPVQGGA